MLLLSSGILYSLEMLLVLSTASCTLYFDTTQPQSCIQEFLHTCVYFSSFTQNCHFEHAKRRREQISSTNAAALCSSFHFTCHVVLSSSSNSERMMAISLRGWRYDHSYWWASVTSLKLWKAALCSKNKKQIRLIFAGSNQPPHSHPLCPHMCEIKAIAALHLTGNAIPLDKTFCLQEESGKTHFAALMACESWR